MATDTNSYYGQADPTTAGSDFNAQRFAIQQQIAKLNTSLPVQVTGVTTVGVNPVGFVKIRILVDQLSGIDMAIPHGDIDNVPYFRLQGGTNAVIIDPEIGDIGMASFCSRDITAVKNARQAALPGSRRMHSFADCMYFGGFLNAAPTQYIQFTAGGILVHSPTKIRLEAPSIELGDVGSTLRALIDERLIAIYNNHVHASGGSGIPTVPLTLPTVATTITKAS